MTGFAFCGSFCNMRRAIDVLRGLCESGEDVMPILSETVYATDTRFGKAEDFRREIENVCGRAALHTIPEAEPLGPKVPLDVLCVCPCTGNTLAKMACGICDTSVTMAAKAHLRNERPLVLALASNDALSLGAPNIGRMLQRKHVYFVPFSQDDPEKKPRSLVCDFSRVPETLAAARRGVQLQPIVF